MRVNVWSAAFVIALSAVEREEVPQGMLSESTTGLHTLRTQLDAASRGANAFSHGVTLLPAREAAAGNVILVKGFGGNDTTTCGAVGNPCQTISFAINFRASDGDTVRVKAGVYEEIVDVTKSGSQNQPIVVEGVNRKTVTIAPSLAPPPADEGQLSSCSNISAKAVARAVNITGREWIVFRNLTIRGGIEIAGGGGTSQLNTPTYDAGRDRQMPGRAIRDSAAAATQWDYLEEGCPDSTGTRQCGSGIHISPATSISIVDNIILERGIYVHESQSLKISGNEIHHTICGSGPGIQLNSLSLFSLVTDNYIHHTGDALDLAGPGSDSTSWHHFMDEGIRISRNSVYNRVINNFVDSTSSGTVSPESQPHRPGRGITGDVFASWNTYSSNTVRDAEISFSQQSANWGQDHFSNLSISARHGAFTLNGGSDRQKEYADVGAVRYSTYACNAALSSGETDFEANHATNDEFSDNFFGGVAGAGEKTYVRSTEPVTAAQWANVWQGGTFPPASLAGNFYTFSDSSRLAGNVAFRDDCGCAGSTLVPAPPRVCGSGGRANLLLTFTTKVGTVHPDSSDNHYDMSEPADVVSLPSVFFADSSDGPSSGQFGGIGSPGAYLFRARADIPEIAAYRDSLTLAAFVNFAGMPNVDTQDRGTIASRWKSGTGQPQMWRWYHVRSTDAVVFAFTDTTGAGRTCSTGSGGSDRSWEFWAVVLKDTTDVGGPSSLVHLYRGRRGETHATPVKTCKTQRAPIDTTLVVDFAVGRQFNAFVDDYKGQIGSFVASNRALSAATIDSVFLRGPSKALVKWR